MMIRLPLLLAASLALAGTAAAAVEAPDLSPDLKINQIQVLGTHNSYHAAVDPHILKMMDGKLPSMGKIVASLPEAARRQFLIDHPNDVSFSQALDYSHPTLTEQLDLGVRGLEIDVNADPAGGAYGDPAAYRILRAQGVSDLLPFDPATVAAPGLKVLHMPDVDFRSTCPTFRSCIAEIRAWSDRHPGHVPIFVMVEAKVKSFPILPGSSPVPPFTPETYDEIDRTILEGLPRDRIITPDDVRGDYPTLEAAVLAGHWPTLGKSRGKVMFLLMTATGHDGAAPYLVGHPGLKGRVAFMDSQPGQAHAAFILDDNAVARGAEVRDEVKRGYFVRTRSDIETYEARINDMSRARTTFANGGQIVSTDYEKPGDTPGTTYVVGLPGGAAARCNPVSAPDCGKQGPRP